MFKLISLSNVARNLTNVKNLPKVKLITTSRYYATLQPKGNSEEEPANEDRGKNETKLDTVHYDQPKPDNKLQDFEVDLFMNDLERLNMQLSAKHKQKYIDFIQQPAHVKLFAVWKSVFKNCCKLIGTEMFGTHMFENDKHVDQNDIDAYWVFNSQKDIERWMIACDYDLNRGYSSCSLSVNRQGRLVFSGYLECEKVPKDGQHVNSGFAHLSSQFKKTGFGLESYYDWSQFTHFIIRFRGDGRVYRILLRSYSMHGAQTDSFYEYYLYTRGGPYWQTAKIPYSKFILCYKEQIQDKPQPLSPDQIQEFAITVTKYTGPFQLEISHIGMILDVRNYQETDYEGYFRPELV